MLSINSDAKTIKGLKRGYLTGILYLAPHKLSGANLCPDASPGCISTCLNTAGRGVFNSVQKARIRKTQYFRKFRNDFMRELDSDIIALQRRAIKLKLTPLVRLNGTSDIPWENVTYKVPSHNGLYSLDTVESLIKRHGDIQFYDYTK